MRVAIFSDNFYPELSGISDSVLALGKNLVRRGHHVHFFVPKYSKKDYLKIGTVEKELTLDPKIGITRFWSFSYHAPSGQGRAVIPNLWNWRQAKAFNPDIIHTQLFYGAGIEALIAAKKLRVPLIGTNHTAVKAYTKFYPIQAAWFSELLLQYVNWYYGKCRLITAPSRSVLEEMKFSGYAGECHVISNPIDTITFRSLSNKNILRQRLNFSEKTVIFASHLSAEKNIDVLIKAIALVKKEIPSALLVLAGKGPSESALKKLSLSLGIESSVKFLGFLSKPALAEAYNASKIFAIASTAETQSMVTMQAMATGLPIIAAKSRALPEYVSKKNGFLVEPGDINGFAEKIIYLLRNPALRKTLGANGRRLAEKFSAPEITAVWEKIYKKALNGNGPVESCDPV